MARYLNEKGEKITEAVFLVGKSARATKQATDARKDLESAELDEEAFIKKEEGVESLERQAAKYLARCETLNGATKVAVKETVQNKDASK
jgi:hypothetical protein